MRVNIKNNEIASIDFLNVDEVIEFIQKFNKDGNKEESDRNFVEFDKIINSNRINQEPIPVWCQCTNDPYVQRINIPDLSKPNQFKVEDPISYPYTITSATK